MKCYRSVERRKNDEIIKKTSEIKVKGSLGKGRPKKKWVEVIRGDVRECELIRKWWWKKQE